MQKDYPQPAVGAFIVNPKKQLLLIKSHKWANGRLWSVPGGRVELGEKISQAVKREVYEEVGLKVKFIKVFTVMDAVNPLNFFRKQHFIFLECLCKSESSKFKLDQNEIQFAEWFDLDQIDQLNLETFTKKGVTELKKIKL